MKFLVLFFAVYFILIISSFAQAPDTLWTKTFGGDSLDGGLSVQQTTDGGYILAGYTSSFGAGEGAIWLIKTDASGDTMWTKTFGGSVLLHDSFYSVQQTSDGGYILAGHTDSFGAGESDVWLIKTDVSGDTLWTKTFGGSSDDWGFSVQQTSDGGYILSGSTSSFGAGDGDVWLIKTDVSGDTLWTKTFGGDSTDWGLSVQQTSDNGYILAGHTYSFGAGKSDVWLIKTDVWGDTLWAKTFGGSNYDACNSVQQTTDGGYILAGSTRNFGAGENDVWLIKTDASGDTIWTKTFGGSSSDGAKSIQKTTDGGYILTGMTRSFGAGIMDVWLIKTDSSGDTLWTKTFGGANFDIGQSVQQTTDGEYIIIGSTLSFGAGEGDVWLIKTGTGTVVDNEIRIVDRYSLEQNYPNPFNPTTNIKYQIPELSYVTLKVYDVLGSELITLVNEEQSIGSYEVEFNATNLPSGIYFYKLQAVPTGRQAGSFVETKKMVLMK